MPSKLQKVIAYYEQERTHLATLIAACVAEYEFKSAHGHGKTLRRLNYKLQTLHNLADPLHDEKEACLRSIAGLKKGTDDKPSDTMRRYYQELMQKKEQQLAQLHQSAAAVPVAPKHSALQTVLDLLGQHRIDNFTLLVDEVQGISFTVCLVRQTLFITLAQVRRLREKQVLRKSQIRYLQRLGFRLYDHDDKLILWLHYDGEPANSTVRTMLARIIFEKFYFREFAGRSSIKYVEKPAV